MIAQQIANRARFVYIIILELVGFKDDELARTVEKLSSDGELADQDEA